MPLILPRANPLAYPAGIAPGFDLSHPLASAIRFSGVTFNGGFFNLFRSRNATIGGVPASVITVAGPATNFAGASDIATFTGQPTTNDTSVTIAGIMRRTSALSNKYVFDSGGAGGASGGWGINLSNTNLISLVIFPSFASKNASLTLTTGVPYFFWISANGSSSVDFLICDLTTGVITTGVSGTGLASSAPNGTYTIGALSGGGFVANADVYALAFSAQYNPLTLAKMVAADPWSFWYPRWQIDRVGQAAAAFQAAWAMNSNIVMGAGARVA